MRQRLTILIKLGLMLIGGLEASIQAIVWRRWNMSWSSSVYFSQLCIHRDCSSVCIPMGGKWTKWFFDDFRIFEIIYLQWKMKEKIKWKKKKKESGKKIKMKRQQIVIIWIIYHILKCFKEHNYTSAHLGKKARLELLICSFKVSENYI